MDIKTVEIDLETLSNEVNQVEEALQNLENSIRQAIVDKLDVEEPTEEQVTQVEQRVKAVLRNVLVDTLGVSTAKDEG